jgi:hypothetical protein
LRTVFVSRLNLKKIITAMPERQRQTARHFITRGKQGKEPWAVMELRVGMPQNVGGR